MQNDLSAFIDFSKELAHASGDIIRKYFRTSIDIDSKGDTSPVTIADKQAEETMRKMISDRFKDHGIIGEEFGESNPNADYKWILDPIDGTVSFISGAQSFGTLIALTFKDKPILGVFHQPILNELLIGTGKQTTLLSNGTSHEVKMRSCPELHKATLLATDLKHIKQHQNIEKFSNLIDQVQYFRGWGDCYGYYLLATGYADIMIDPIMNLWDIAALIPIVEGAGGVITNYQGKTALGANSIIAAGPELHSKVVAALN